jgi:hypothetical protein
MMVIIMMIMIIIIIIIIIIILNTNVFFKYKPVINKILIYLRFNLQASLKIV